MTAIPQRNAALLAVSSSGASEDYDTGPGPNSTKWQGNSGIYVSDREKTVQNQSGELNRVRQVVVYMDPELHMQVGVQMGDYVTYVQTGTTRMGRVQNVEAASLPGTPSYMRLPLEEVLDS